MLRNVAICKQRRRSVVIDEILLVWWWGWPSDLHLDRAHMMHVGWRRDADLWTVHQLRCHVEEVLLRWCYLLARRDEVLRIGKVHPPVV